MSVLQKIAALRDSAAQDEAGTVTGTAVVLNQKFDELIATLAVSASATDAGDTLDVYVDTSFDAGTTWVNLGHFTQVLGNGGAKTFVLAIKNGNPGASAVYDATSDAAAGATRQIGFGDRLRYRGVMVDADANGSFTYAVSAFLK
jgi:hypothetical protein